MLEMIDKPYAPTDIATTWTEDILMKVQRAFKRMSGEEALCLAYSNRSGGPKGIGYLGYVGPDLILKPTLSTWSWRDSTEALYAPGYDDVILTVEAIPMEPPSCASTACDPEELCDEQVLVCALKGLDAWQAESEIERRKGDADGTQCRLNSDCTVGMQCVSEACVPLCREDRDCADGQRCLLSENGYIECI